jgi:hypothetical protein
VPLHAAYRGFIGDIFVKWKFEAITRLENNLRVRNDYKGYIDSVCAAASREIYSNYDLFNLSLLG